MSPAGLMPFYMHANTHKIPPHTQCLECDTVMSGQAQMGFPFDNQYKNVVEYHFMFFPAFGRFSFGCFIIEIQTSRKRCPVSVDFAYVCAQASL